MDEKFLYHIWDAGHIRPDLKTISGKSLKVVFPGQFNTNRGPDFVNAIISINGEELQGSVEIHLHTLDWTRHSHHEDLYFNPVILHVVQNHNGSHLHTIKENGELVEILELRDQLSEDIAKLVEEAETNGTVNPGAYCDLLSGIDKEHLISIISWHGKQRLAGKIRRFNAALSLSDFDQILYEGLMEAAGYDKNKLNMSQLAQSLPFSRLQEWYKEGMSCTALASIMAVSSGLLEKSKSRISPSQYAVLMQAYEQQAWHGRKIPIDWQLFRIRPSNHPLIRILILSEFLFSSLESGLLNRFLKEVESSAPNPGERFKRFVELFGKPSENTLIQNHKLGKQIISSIHLNIYIPVLLLYAQKVANQKMQDSLYLSWESFPALAGNYITRYMCRHLNPGAREGISRKSLYQQGLINLYYSYCRYHLCSQCVANKC